MSFFFWHTLCIYIYIYILYLCMKQRTFSPKVVFLLCKEFLIIVLYYYTVTTIEQSSKNI